MPSVFDRILLALSGELRQQQVTVTALKAQMESVMATQADFDQRMADLDAATDEIAADLQSLRDQMAAAGIPDSVLAGLDTRIARLQALGKDPSDPVPLKSAADSDNIVWST